MPDIVRTPAHNDLMDDYLDSQSGESRPAIPLVVDFVRQLVGSTPATCPAVVEGGFLDMMLCIYVATMVPRTIYVGKSITPVRPVTEEKTYMALLDSSSAALRVISRTSIGARSIERHPIYVLGLLIRPNPFTQSIRRQTKIHTYGQLSSCIVESPHTWAGASTAVWSRRY